MIGSIFRHFPPFFFPNRAIDAISPFLKMFFLTRSNLKRTFWNKQKAHSIRSQWHTPHSYLNSESDSHDTAETSQGSIDRRPEPDAIEAQTKSCLPVHSIAGFEQTKKETKRFIDAQSAFGVKRAKTRVDAPFHMQMRAFWLNIHLFKRSLIACLDTVGLFRY